VPAPASDAEYYEAAARSIAHGEGYAVARNDAGFASGGEATAFWPPGYSVYLAAFQKPFGDGPAIPRAANVIAGALVVIPTYFIGRRLTCEGAGLFGAAIAAVLPSLVFWTPVLLSETLFTLLFASCLALVLSVATPGRAAAISIGLLVGVATLTRGQALVLVPLAAVWWLLSDIPPRQTLGSVALVCAGVAALVAPWAARNAFVMDAPIVLSANTGYNLRVGHAPYSTGRYTLPDDLWNTKPGISFHDREAVFNGLGTRRAAGYAARHPIREVQLAGRKIVWLWRPDSDALDWVASFDTTPLPGGSRQPLLLALDVSYGALLALSLAGLWWLRHNRRELAFVLSLIGAWTLLHIVFFGEPRYHLPLLAVLAPLAASGLLGAVAALTPGRKAAL
jgi:4-amino-4-deoxy-L-arabinose transferase-like glycosyltransferase